MRLAAAGAIGLCVVGPALGETSVSAYEAARQALFAVWAELPLSVRNVTLTRAPATGFGNYTAHDGSSYAPGETIHLYVEVLGYGWRDNGDGTQSVLLDADLNLLDKAGTTIASKPKFLTTDIRSHDRRLETYLTLDASLKGFAPGDYTLQYVLHDVAARKDATFTVPVTLAASGASSSSAR
jgi:hypothetical protein